MQIVSFFRPFYDKILQKIIFKHYNWIKELNRILEEAPYLSSMSKKLKYLKIFILDVGKSKNIQKTLRNITCAKFEFSKNTNHGLKIELK